MTHSEAGGPVVTVITPTYNMAEWLPRCIASVEAQTYPNVEHIVVDGGSTDGTRPILEASDSIVWISEPDRGQTDAINKGLRLAQGSVLGWLNADDELTPEAIERVVCAFADQPQAGLCYGDIDVVEDGRPSRTPPPGEYSIKGMWCSNSLSQPGTFWTRAAQDRIGELDETFHLAMDFDLWLRFAHAGVSGVYIPEVQARFEVHEAAKTSIASWTAIADEEARALRKHGELHGAAMAINRWYWAETLNEIGIEAANGNWRRAALHAAEVEHRMMPLRRNTRWFIRLAKVAPRLAGRLYALRLEQAARRG